jgi:DUF1009 family protein
MEYAVSTIKSMDKIGLIAGSSRFPILFARAAKKRGISVYAVALKEETDRGLEKIVDGICWVSLGELGKAVDFFKKEGIKQAVMAGKVHLEHIYNKAINLDGYLKSIFVKIADKRGDTLLLAVAAFLDKIGIKLLDCAIFLKEDIAKKGALTKLSPTREQFEDIEFAKPIIKAIAQLRIGQTIVVKDKAVLAVEAMEGTDKAIERGAAIAKEGAVIVKMSSPRHDMRFDIPLVGPSTIEVMKKACARVLTIEAGRTLLIDKEEFLKLADGAGICVIAV